MEFRFIGAIVGMAVVGFGTAALAQAQPGQGKPIDNSFICTFKPGIVFPGGEKAAAANAVAAVGGSVTQVYDKVLGGFAAHMSAQGAANLKRWNLNVQNCEQDQIVSLPDYKTTAVVKGSGTTTQPPQQTPWGIARVKGGQAIGTPFPTAWVIDTGIDPKHPDLNVDTGRSRSFLFNSTSYVDANGHGTHVAGTIAARDNSIGVIGVAPGARVVAVRVLDRSGSGSISGVIAGVNYVAATAAAKDVANMSLGGGVSDALDKAVADAAAKGIYFAVAAGNSSADASTSSPARVNATNVYTVSAFASGDAFASFSNFGAGVDYSAPGVSVRSTWLSGGYNTISGTSMATPHVAGLLMFGPGRIVTDGVVTGDPDGTADPIPTLSAAAG